MYLLADTQPWHGALLVAHGRSLPSTACVQQFFSPPLSLLHPPPPQVPHSFGQQAFPNLLRMPSALSQAAFVMVLPLPGPGGCGEGEGDGGTGGQPPGQKSIGCTPWAWCAAAQSALPSCAVETEDSSGAWYHGGA